MDLDGFYASISDDDAFSRLSQRIAEAAGTRSAIFVEVDGSGATQGLQACYWSDELMKDYVEQFMAQDPWTRLAIAIGRQDRAAALDEPMAPEAFARTAIYNDLFRSYGDDTGRFLGVLPTPGRPGIMVAVHRAASDVAFDRSDEHRLNTIYEHLKRIMPLRRLLEVERRRSGSLQDLADQSDHGLLRVDRDLRVLGLSAEAQRILDARDGLYLRGNRLATSGELENRLRAAVAAIINRQLAAQTGFQCARPSGSRPYRLALLPAGFEGHSGAIIKIDDPEVHLDSASMGAIRSAYGLTSMELSLAHGLFLEKSVEEIAAQRGVGRETVKTQLKALFQKTGVNRQSALVKLLATFPLGSAK